MSRNNFRFLLLSISALFIVSTCTIDSKDIADEIITTTLASEEAQKQFYHAWLADCMNDVSYKAKDALTAKKHFEGIAKGRLKLVIETSVIKSQIGTEKLVWGPIVSAGNQGNGKYVSRNLLYCVQSVGPTGVIYSIGISGTDMVSPFDWMSEDLNVDTQVDWSEGGKISEGSNAGFLKLSGLVESSSGKTLLGYLVNELFTHPNATINIAGHSLGGALTQVYSSYLKNSLTHATAHPKVNAWVYAGPSAGDSVFASTLTNTVDNYNSYSNHYDVIPHAWEKSSLEQLCTLYRDAVIYKYKPLFSNEYYYHIGNPTAMKGVVYYLRSKSKNGNYKDPGLVTNQYSFSMGTSNYMLSEGEFDAMDALLGSFYDIGNNDLYKYLNQINQRCSGGSDIGETEFKQFFYYMTEMGTQHTTVYFDYFFQGTNDDFKAAVTKAVPGGETDWDDLLNAGEGKAMLEEFLGEVAEFYSQSTDCGCNAEVN